MECVQWYICCLWAGWAERVWYLDMPCAPGNQVLILIPVWIIYGMCLWHGTWETWLFISMCTQGSCPGFNSTAEHSLAKHLCVRADHHQPSCFPFFLTGNHMSWWCTRAHMADGFTCHTILVSIRILPHHPFSPNRDLFFFLALWHHHVYTLWLCGTRL